MSSRIYTSIKWEKQELNICIYRMPLFCKKKETSINMYIYLLIFTKANTGKIDQKLIKVGEDWNIITGSKISLNIPV